MFASHLARMNKHIERVMFDSTCIIESPNGDGTWTSQGSFVCNVQSTVNAPSTEDRLSALPDEIQQASLFLKADAPIEVGYRVLWNDRIWNMGADTADRSSKGMVRVIITDWKAAIEPVDITFYRMRDGNRFSVGTFTVQIFTNDRSYMLGDPRSDVDSGSASGTTDTGSMTGDHDLSALMIGDWFSLSGRPGRITDVTVVDPERVRCSYIMDRQKV